MKELRSKKFLPPNPQKDAAGLASLIGFLNDSRITGAVVPPEERKNLGATPPAKAAPVLEQPTPKTQTASQGSVAPVSASAPRITKVVLSGRFLSGKDWCAEKAGLTIFSLAEPLYALQKFFFGSNDKTAPGAREFLQTVGQWGRGELNAQYPLTPERALFIQHVRHNLPSDFEPSVSWKLFGSDPELWLNALLARVDAHLEKNPAARIAVTNARFSNELTRLTSESFVHFHCMTSAATWTERLKKVGLTPESPATKDMSEQLAAGLDQNVTKTLSAQRQGNKLRAIWCDERVPAPSNRLLTVADFCAMFPKQ